MLQNVEASKKPQFNGQYTIRHSDHISFFRAIDKNSISHMNLNYMMQKRQSKKERKVFSPTNNGSKLQHSTYDNYILREIQ